MDESQDSGGSGNFLSPGVGQGLASPTARRSRPPPPGPLGAGALRTKEAGHSAPTRSGLGAAVPGFRRRRPGLHVRPLPAGRKEPAGATSGRRRLARPSAPREMNGAALLLCRRCGSRSSLATETKTAAGGGGSWGPHAGSHLPPSLPTRPRPASPLDRGRPGCPTAARSPQLLAVRPRNSPVVRL